MMGHKIWFYGEIWLIIPKLSLLPLLIWSTDIRCLFYMLCQATDIILNWQELCLFILSFCTQNNQNWNFGCSECNRVIDFWKYLAVGEFKIEPVLCK